MDRNLDRIYFRVERNGKFKNVCFSDLTATERYEICKDQSAKNLSKIACHLASRLKDIGDKFDIVGR